MEIGIVIAVVVKTTNAKRHTGLVHILLPKRRRHTNIATHVGVVIPTATRVINAV